MSWRNLIAEKDEHFFLPWLGGRKLHFGARSWTIEGDLPLEHGWYEYACKDRSARLGLMCERISGTMNRHWAQEGYLVGDALVPDGAWVSPEPFQAMRQGRRVHLIEDGLDRFARVRAGTWFDLGPLVYLEQLFPLGPEEEVLAAFLDGKRSVDHVKGVMPALDAAFRLEVWLRDEADKRRALLEKQRREEEERRQREAKRKELFAKLGDGASRREMAAVDFASAAKAALAVGGGTLLDERKGQRGERVVRFRVGGERFECVCDERTMRVIEAGICLEDHDTGIKGDAWLTLESLPPVVREAQRTGQLVRRRYV